MLKTLENFAFFVYVYLGLNDNVCPNNSYSLERSMYKHELEKVKVKAKVKVYKGKGKGDIIYIRENVWEF